MVVTHTVHMQKIKIKGQWVREIEWKLDRQTDGRRRLHYLPMLTRSVTIIMLTYPVTFTVTVRLFAHLYSVRAFSFGRRVSHLSVCPASDLEN